MLSSQLTFPSSSPSDRKFACSKILWVCTPKLLIAEDPTTALDVTIQAQFLDLLADLKVSHGLAMILITHDLGVVARICNRVAVMYGGRIVETGTVQELLSNPAHPYTQALVGSVARIGRRTEALYSIDGQLPDVHHLPNGCTFRPRCRHILARCREEYRPEKDLGAGRRRPIEVTCLNIYRPVSYP